MQQAEVERVAPNEDGGGVDRGRTQEDGRPGGCGRPAAAEQLIAEMETARQPILDGIDILSGNDIARVTYSS